MSTLTRRAAALTLVSAFALAGCSGGSGGSDESPETDSSSSATTEAPAADAATGDTIEGTGYSFVVPEGWAIPEQEIPGTEQTDVFAADLQDADGFSDNVNVISDPTLVGVDREKIEDSVEQVLESVNARDIEIKDPTEIAGEEAVRVGATFEQNDISYLTEQYAVEHDGKGFVVTFSFSDTVSEADRERVADSVLTTWTWAS